MAGTSELSYGGIALEVPRDDVRKLLASYRFDLQYPFLCRAPAGEFAAAFASRQVALPNFPDNPPLVAGRFFYPTHASRWSWYIGVVGQTHLGLIEDQLEGAQPVSLPFIMQADDVTHIDNSGGINTPMFMLPPRPLGVTSSTNPREPLYLIVLVDERYNWQFRPAGVIDTTALATWDTFLASLETSLGITVSHDVFSAAYLSPEPDSDLYSSYESAALLMDAIGWNTGRTFVRNYDATYSFIRPGNAAFSRPSTPRYRAFGGDIYDPQETGVVQPWINAALPEKVIVTFPKFNNATGLFVDPDRDGFFVKDSYGAVYAIQVTLAELGTPYDNYVGVADLSKFIHDTCKALVLLDTDPIPINDATLNALAMQLAADYYDQQLTALDEAYNGIRDWAPDPLNDLIFEMQPPNLVQTRVMRKPWDFQAWQMQHHVDSTPQPTVTITLVTNVCDIIA